MRKRYRRSGFFEDTIAGIIIRGVLYLIGGLALMFALMLMSAKLEPSVFSIIIRSVISAVMLFFTFFGKERLSLIDVMASLTVVLTVWLPMVLGSKAGLAFVIAVMIVLAGYIAHMHMFKRRTIKVLGWEWVYLLYVYISKTLFYTFKDDNSTLWFFILPVIMSVASVPVSMILFDKGLIRLKDQTLSEAVCAVIIIAFVVLAVFYCGTYHVNYIFDSSDPIEQTAVIKEAEVIHGARSSISYHFTLDINGSEINMQVTEHEYFNYKEGDEYKVELYEGALGAQYYMSGE